MFKRMYDIPYSISRRYWNVPTNRFELGDCTINDKDDKEFDLPSEQSMNSFASIDSKNTREILFQSVRDFPDLRDNLELLHLKLLVLRKSYDRCYYQDMSPKWKNHYKQTPVKLLNISVVDCKTKLYKTPRKSRKQDAPTS